MAQHNKNAKNERKARERQRIILAVCACAVLLGIILAIRAKTTAGMVFALILCILSIAAALYLLLAMPYSRPKSSGGALRSADRRPAQTEPRPAERFAASSARHSAYRSVIDIPLDGEERGSSRRAIEPPKPEKAPEPVAAAPVPAPVSSIFERPEANRCI